MMWELNLCGLSSKRDLIKRQLFVEWFNVTDITAIDDGGKTFVFEYLDPAASWPEKGRQRLIIETGDSAGNVEERSALLSSWIFVRDLLQDTQFVQLKLPICRCLMMTMTEFLTMRTVVR